MFKLQLITQAFPCQCISKLLKHIYFNTILDYTLHLVLLPLLTLSIFHFTPFILNGKQIN